MRGFAWNFKLIDDSKFKLDFGINGESFKNELTAMPIDPATGLQQNLDISGRFGRAKGRSLYEFYIEDLYFVFIFYNSFLLQILHRIF